MYRTPREEEIARQLRESQQLAQSYGVTPGMTSAYAQSAPQRYDDRMFTQANLDTSGLERRFNREMDVAAALRGTEMPEGRTVGPSGIYVQNPYEQAAAGIKRLVGGYMERKANEGTGAELEAAEKQRSGALARIAREDRDRKREQQAFDNAQKILVGERADRDFEAEERQRGVENEQTDRLFEADRGESTMNRAYMELVDIETGESAGSIRQGDDIPEGTMTVEAFTELYGDPEDRGITNEDFGGFSGDIGRYIGGLGSAGERERARLLYNSLKAGNVALEESITALKEGKDWTGKADIFVDMTDNLFGAAAANQMRGALRNGDELSIKNMIYSTYEGLKRAATGANLTGVEIRLDNVKNPAADGISEEEAIRRMDLLLTDVNRQLDTFGLPQMSITEIPEDLAARGGSKKNGRTRGRGQMGRNNASMPPKVSTQADYDALESGDIYIDTEDGKEYRKP